MQLTGNETATKGIGGPTGPPASEWHPSGKITVYDNYAGEIPLVGAKVRARRWFAFHRSITNSQGRFSVDGTFKRPANYSIIWERDDWDIRNGWYGEALFNGPKLKGEWNLYIQSGKSLNFATIHRAAERMLHQYILGMSRKANPSRLSICHIDKEGTGDYWGDVASWILPSIRIYGRGNQPSDIFKTTIHELAHANHCSQVGRLDYWQTRKIIYESWADCVEKYITEDEYARLLGGEETALLRLYGEYDWVGGDRVRTMGDLPFLVPNYLNHQSWSYKSIGSLGDFNGIKDFGTIDRSSIAYSALFIDFIDEDNQRDYYIGVARKYNAQTPTSQQVDINKNAVLIPNDYLRNFTLAQIQKVIHKSYGLASLKTNFIADYPGYTREIEELFKSYEDYWYRLGL